MTKIVASAALAASLSLAGLSAHASCADPRMPAGQGASPEMGSLNLPEEALTRHFEGEGAGEKIVGTWHVKYTSNGEPFTQAFIQWHSDRTEWENISQPTLGGNICLGSWKVVDRTHVFRNHIGWLFTNGIVSGYFTETETDEVSWDGNSYSGVNDTKIYDLKGNFIVEVPGTSSAARIKP